MHPLLQHVMEETCTDPDCEVHNIEVAVEEQVVSETDVAFWLAGYLRAIKVLADNGFVDAPNELLLNHRDELHCTIVLNPLS